MNHRKIRKIFFLFLVLGFCFGCATSSNREDKSFSFPRFMSGEKKDPFNEFAEQWRLKAREQEKNVDWNKSLKNWEVVAALLPADPEAKAKVALLRKQVSDAAERHYQKGIARYQNSLHSQARKEFLLALYFNPAHAEALHYLKSKLPGEDTILHVVKRGETLRSIAQEAYQDSQKDFLVAYFNGLEPDRKIAPPGTLILPLLDSPGTKKEADTIKAPADTTKEAAGQRDQRQSPSGANHSKAHIPSPGKNSDSNPKYRESLNGSYYEAGKQLSQEKKFQEALEAFYRVDPGYKDVNAQIAHNKKQLADSHYINGVKYFAEEEIERAIDEWETTLTLDPAHPKAKKDIETARLLLQKLEKIK